MKIKFSYMVSILCLSVIITQAQQTKIQPLKIGDKIPDFVFANLKNTSNKTQKASDLYKHGLLIINFWATWCVPCVREIPFLDSVVNQKSAVFKMICVTNQSHEDVDKYLARNSGLKNLLFSAADTKLIKYFPHHTLPHNIWIDESGIVRGITGDQEINEKNIQAFLDRKEKLEKKAEDLSFDWTRNLQVADTEIIYRSVITPFKNIGNGGALLPDTTKRNWRFLAWNRPITDLVWDAVFRRAMDERDWKLVDIITKDSSKFFYPNFIKLPNWQRTYTKEINQWAQKNEFCYELQMSKEVPLDTFYNHLISNLKSIFSLKIQIEMKLSDCIIITKLPGKILKPSQENENRISLHIEKTAIIAKNQTLQELTTELSEFNYRRPPYVDQTGIKFNIDLYKDFNDISGGITFEMLKSYLNEIGLDINEGKALYPHLVIQEL